MANHTQNAKKALVALFEEAGLEVLSVNINNKNKYELVIRDEYGRKCELTSRFNPEHPRCKNVLVVARNNLELQNS